MQDWTDPHNEDAFHTVAALFRHKMDLVTVSSDVGLESALRLMLDQRYSQVPVVDDGECRGVVSFRSIARGVASMGSEPLHLDKLTVKDVITPATYISSSHQEVPDGIRY